MASEEYFFFISLYFQIQSGLILT